MQHPMVESRRIAPIAGHLTGTRLAAKALAAAGAPVSARLAELERLLNRVAASWHASPQLLEQRAGHRVRYTKPLLITPLDDATEEPLAEPLLVTGRDISPGGVSFIHRDPLACRLVAVRFPALDALSDGVITRLNWCRFTRAAVYQSGGTFVRTVQLPPIGECSLVSGGPFEST